MFLPKSFVYYSCVGSCRNTWGHLGSIAHHRIEGTSGTPELRFTQSIRGPEGRSRDVTELFWILCAWLWSTRQRVGLRWLNSPPRKCLETLRRRTRMVIMLMSKSLTRSLTKPLPRFPVYSTKLGWVVILDRRRSSVTMEVSLNFILLTYWGHIPLRVSQRHPKTRRRMRSANVCMESLETWCARVASTILTMSLKIWLTTSSPMQHGQSDPRTTPSWRQLLARLFSVGICCLTFPLLQTGRR